MKRALFVVALLLAAAAVSVWFFQVAPLRRAKAREAALANARLGKFALALEMLDKTDDEETAAARARCLDALGRSQAEAGELWQRLSRSGDPERRREALYQSGWHLLAAGKVEPARAALEALLREDPNGPYVAGARFGLGEASRRQGDRKQARGHYRAAISGNLAGPAAEAAREKLGEINLSLLSDGSEDYTDSYRVRAGDSLGSIAGRFHTTAELLRNINGLSHDLLRLGQTLRVPAGDFSLVVSKQANRLTLLFDDEFFAVFPVGTGRNNCSPEGVFEITTKLVDPVWYSSEGEIPPGDPRNILGTRWMGFNDPYASYGIHGTTQPETIGTQSSSGCIRMNNRDAELLFTLLPRGTKATIVP